MITVRMRTDDHRSTVEYPTATKWHVDERGGLHLIAGKGNVGTHAAGTWACVKEDGQTVRNAVGDLVPAVEAGSLFDNAFGKLCEALGMNPAAFNDDVVSDARLAFQQAARAGKVSA
ncbi:hypothetical protein RhoFasB10_03771 [Rhodococcus sp. B10]|nr:hypothetical protein [Rhodococcus sp. B10]